MPEQVKRPKPWKKMMSLNDVELQNDYESWNGVETDAATNHS
jgi:hypothetical protein